MPALKQFQGQLEDQNRTDNVQLIGIEIVCGDNFAFLVEQVCQNHVGGHVRIKVILSVFRIRGHHKAKTDEKNDQGDNPPEVFADFFQFRCSFTAIWQPFKGRYRQMINYSDIETTGMIATL